ncbi:MAG TPA: hypothetical protein VHQ86_03645 [Candidatus Saccharimonadia bacterium]|jgi:hypothetical protein|nr:hypothetical protein [Candidatus Saccharimonadia bacterium]
MARYRSHPLFPDKSRTARRKAKRYAVAMVAAWSSLGLFVLGIIMGGVPQGIFDLLGAIAGFTGAIWAKRQRGSDSRGAIGYIGGVICALWFLGHFFYWLFA